VAEGGEKGLCWIVDLFLGDTKVTKFSGTDQAGSNTNLAGMTADAFAHFSLHDSDGNFALVDIQGGQDIIYFTMKHILTFFNPQVYLEMPN